MADIFDTRTMLRAMEQSFEPSTFLLSTLFDRVEVSPSEYVDIDIVKRGRKLAPFVSPVVEGKTVRDEGYTTRTYRPPYLKPKKPTTAQQLLDRLPGEDPYSGRSASSRAAEKLLLDLMELDDTITRREEWMAAQALQTGTVKCTGEGIDELIDFGLDPSHKVTLSGSDRWIDAASTPLADIGEWVGMIRKASGLNADILIGGIDAINALVAKLDGEFDTRRIDLGLISPSELSNGAAYYGDIKANGAVIAVYLYEDYYTDEETGATVPVFDANRVVLTSTRADFRQNYGAIQDIRGLAAARRFPKSWVVEDPSARFVMVQSAPLPALHQADALVTAQVV